MIYSFLKPKHRWFGISAALIVALGFGPMAEAGKKSKAKHLRRIEEASKPAQSHPGKLGEKASCLARNFTAVAPIPPDPLAWLSKTQVDNPSDVLNKAVRFLGMSDFSPLVKTKGSESDSSKRYPLTNVQIKNFLENDFSEKLRLELQPILTTLGSPGLESTRRPEFRSVEWVQLAQGPSQTVLPHELLLRLQSKVSGKLGAPEAELVLAVEEALRAKEESALLNRILGSVAEGLQLVTGAGNFLGVEETNGSMHVGLIPGALIQLDGRAHADGWRVRWDPVDRVLVIDGLFESKSSSSGLARARYQILGFSRRLLDPDLFRVGGPKITILGDPIDPRNLKIQTKMGDRWLEDVSKDYWKKVEKLEPSKRELLIPYGKPENFNRNRETLTAYADILNPILGKEFTVALIPDVESVSPELQLPIGVIVTSGYKREEFFGEIAHDIKEAARLTSISNRFVDVVISVINEGAIFGKGHADTDLTSLNHLLGSSYRGSSTRTEGNEPLLRAKNLHLNEPLGPDVEAFFAENGPFPVVRDILARQAEANGVQVRWWMSLKEALNRLPQEKAEKIRDHFGPLLERPSIDLRDHRDLNDIYKYMLKVVEAIGGSTMDLENGDLLGARLATLLDVPSLDRAKVSRFNVGSAGGLVAVRGLLDRLNVMPEATFEYLGMSYPERFFQRLTRHFPDAEWRQLNTRVREGLRSATLETVGTDRLSQERVFDILNWIVATHNKLAESRGGTVIDSYWLLDHSNAERVLNILLEQRPVEGRKPEITLNKTGKTLVLDSTSTIDIDQIFDLNLGAGRLLVEFPGLRSNAHGALSNLTFALHEGRSNPDLDGYIRAVDVRDGQALFENAPHLESKERLLKFFLQAVESYNSGREVQDHLSVQDLQDPVASSKLLATLSGRRSLISSELQRFLDHGAFQRLEAEMGVAPERLLNTLRETLSRFLTSESQVTWRRFWNVQSNRGIKLNPGIDRNRQRAAKCLDLMSEFILLWNRDHTSNPKHKLSFENLHDVDGIDLFFIEIEGKSEGRGGLQFPPKTLSP